MSFCVPQTLVVTQGPTPVVVTQKPADTVVVAMAIPGPPGGQGPVGPSGGTLLVEVGATPLSGHSAVAIDSSGALVPADCVSPAHLGAVIGVVDRAWSPGDEAEVKAAVPLAHSGWSWTPGPVYLGSGGQLTQTLPLGALFCQVLGHAVSQTRVLFDLQPPISIS